jgi:hypothetical protein
MPDNIRALASRVLRNPVEVAVAPVSSTAEGVTQYVLFVGHKDKRHLLAEVLRDPAMTRALVFTRTKRGANRVAEHLEKAAGQRGGHPRQQVPERPGEGAGGVQGRQGPGAGGRPTSPPGASTFRTSPTSSTSSCPTIPRATSIVLVAPPELGGAGWPCPSVTPANAPACATSRD